MFEVQNPRNPWRVYSATQRDADTWEVGMDLWTEDGMIQDSRRVVAVLNEATAEDANEAAQRMQRSYDWLREEMKKASDEQ